MKIDLNRIAAFNVQGRYFGPKEPDAARSQVVPAGANCSRVVTILVGKDMGIVDGDDGTGQGGEFAIPFLYSNVAGNHRGIGRIGAAKAREGGGRPLPIGLFSVRVVVLHVLLGHGYALLIAQNVNGLSTLAAHQPSNADNDDKLGKANGEIRNRTHTKIYRMPPIQQWQDTCRARDASSGGDKRKCRVGCDACQSVKN